MRLLLDECCPRKLRRLFAAHDIRTAAQMGWAGKRNGELLALMAANGFEALITVDRNIQYQQNLAAAGIGVVVLVGVTNKLADLLPLVPNALTALASIKPGDIIEVS